MACSQWAWVGSLEFSHLSMKGRITLEIQAKANHEFTLKWQINCLFWIFWESRPIYCSKAVFIGTPLPIGHPAMKIQSHHRCDELWGRGWCMYYKHVHTWKNYLITGYNTSMRYIYISAIDLIWCWTEVHLHSAISTRTGASLVEEPLPQRCFCSSWRYCW